MATTRYGISPWLHRLSATRRPSYARLRGHRDVEVAIVGGGLTGCLTAYALAVAGVSTLVLESGRIGEGASGHDIGLALVEPQVDFLELRRALGLRAVRRVWRSSRRGAQDLASLLRRLRVGCDLSVADLLEVEIGPEVERQRRRGFEARAAADFDIQWLDARRIRSRTGRLGVGAARVAGNVALDPYRACLGLARAAARRGATICQRSEVLRVSAARGAVAIRTSSGTVEAGTVVIATGTPPRGFEPVRRHLQSRERYAVMTTPLPAAIRREMGRRDLLVRDSMSPAHYLRWTRDGRVIVSGADQPAPHPRSRQRTLVQRTGQLMYELSTLYPAVSGIQPEYGWSVAYGQTRDGLPIVGSHRRYPRHLFALGRPPAALGLAQAASRIILRHLRGAATKEDALFGFTRA